MKNNKNASITRQNYKIFTFSEKYIVLIHTFESEF